jgi:hypothetical protein
MLFVRLIWLLLLPIRAPFMLAGRLLVRGASGAERAGAAAIAGGAPRVLPDPEAEDRRNSVIFVPLTCEVSDEPVIGPGDYALAEETAEKARLYYKIRPDLFPKDDFYERVEANFIDEVTRIDNKGAQDQFVRVLDRARRVTNDNTRTLFCEVAPTVLLLLLLWHGVMLIADPFNMLNRDNPLWSLQAGQVFAAETTLAGVALGVGVLLITAIYALSYANMQRQNTLNLNNFISIEFARLTNMFRVAQRECLQAETMLSDSQRDEVMKKASAWALTYHWVAVRQLVEEFIVRNTMFQIRRNTILYVALGFILCLVISAAMTGLVYLAANTVPNAHTPALMAVGHFAVVSAAFLLVSFGLIMRRPFAIVATNLRKDEWNRFATLQVGDAIAEQVTRDKVQIIINRDRARSAGN